MHKIRLPAYIWTPCCIDVLRWTNTSKNTDHGVYRSANFVHQQIVLSRISIIGTNKTSVLISVANLSFEKSSTTIFCIWQQPKHWRDCADTHAFFTSLSTIFQSCWDGSSLAEPVLSRGYVWSCAFRICDKYRIYNWASTRENLSTGVCEQLRRRPACAYAQSDQRLCCSLNEKFYV